MTAAHVVMDTDRGDPVGLRGGLYDDIRVSPAAHAGERGLGTFDVVDAWGLQTFTHARMITPGEVAYDVAILSTREPIGEWFGWLTSLAWTSAGSVALSGYPGPAGLQTTERVPPPPRA
ncbi:MAG: hypothetical protein EA356_14710 [Geminicoccaceae bacterium]|nr:MAG: hypothetical protein EA356_14710 [Geminicoccaceae bacterium]